jgi:hypothetical protein
MMTSGWCKWLLPLAALCVAHDAAGEGVRDEYAYAARIAPWPDAPLQWFELPVAVYRDAIDPGLRDLRVLNGRGEVVPFALQRPASSVTRPAPDMRLTLFPLRGEQAQEPSALSLTIRGDTTSLEVQAGTSVSSAAPPTAYLIDARGVESPIESLVFEVPQDAPDFSLHATIEVSDDLSRWRRVGGVFALTRLRHGGAIFENLSASFPPTRANYWRLRAPSGAAMPELTGVLAAPIAGNDAVARNRHAVPGQRSEIVGEYLFDLGAHLPVDQLELEPPESNTIVQVDYFARRAADEPWRHVTRANVYRLQSTRTELRSPPQAVSTNASRYWKVVVDPRGGGFGAGVPKMNVGWLPHRVLFVARGDAPFEIVYGNFAAEHGETALSDLLPGGTLTLDSMLAQPYAQLSEPRVAGGPERLVAPAPSGGWRIAILWSSLGIGVISLGAIAWRLARQMRVSS